jgi:hypothetical protein
LRFVSLAVALAYIVPSPLSIRDVGDVRDVFVFVINKIALIALIEDRWGG